jgi:type II secretory pathway component PulK
MLAAFSVILGYSVRQKLSLAMRLQQRDEARFISWANIKLAINEIKKNEAKEFLSFSSEGSSSRNEQAVEEGAENQAPSLENEYRIFAEESKININRCDMPMLKRLFRVLLGCGDIECQELAAAIVDWRDEDSMLSIPLGSAEDSYYTNLPDPYESKDLDFDCLAELLLVKGISQDIFERVRDYVTIYGRGLVDINTAPREVLLALGLGDYVVSNIISFRCGKDNKCGSKDDNYFISASDISVIIGKFCTLNQAQRQRIETVAARYLTVGSNYFMIKSSVRFNQRQNAYRATCVVDAGGKILYWEEF